MEGKGFSDEDFDGLFFMGLCSKRKPSFFFPVKDELPLFRKEPKYFDYPEDY